MSNHQLNWAEPATVTAGPSKRTYTTNKDWEKCKDAIQELRKKNIRLSDIRKIIEAETGFVASEAQYKRRFEVWGDKRKLTKAQRRYMIQQIENKGTMLKFKSPWGEDLDETRVQRIWDKRNREGEMHLDVALSPEGIVTVFATLPDQASTSKDLVQESIGVRVEPVVTSPVSVQQFSDLNTQEQLRAFAQWLLNFLDLQESYEYKSEDGEAEPAITEFGQVRFTLRESKPSPKDSMDKVVANFINFCARFQLPLPNIGPNNIGFRNASKLPYDGAVADGKLKESISSSTGMDAESQLSGKPSFYDNKRIQSLDPMTWLKYMWSPRMKRHRMFDSSDPFGNYLSSEREWCGQSHGLRVNYLSRATPEDLRTRDEIRTPSETWLINDELEIAMKLEQAYRFDEAEEQYLRLCQELKDSVGPKDKDTRGAFLILGRFYRRQLRFDQAWQALSKASMALCDAIDDKMDPNPDDIAIAALELAADIYTLLGDDQKAVNLAEALYKYQIKTCGPKNVETVRSLERLGWILISSGDYDSALMHLSTAEGIAQNIGCSDIITRMDVRFHLNHAAILSGRIKVSVAGWVEKSFLEHLSVRETRYPQMIINLSNTLESLAILKAIQGDYSSSLGYYERCLTTFGRTYGSNHPQTLKIVSGLIPVLTARGLVFYARPLSHYILKVMENLHGPMSSDVLAAILQASQLSFIAEN